MAMAMNNNYIYNGPGARCTRVNTGGIMKHENYRDATTDFHVTGQLIVNGTDIEDEIKRIHSAMADMKKENDLARKYPEIARKKAEYTKALDKYQIFEALK